MPNDDQWMTGESSDNGKKARSLQWLPFRKRKGSHDEQVRSILDNTPLFEGIGTQHWKLLSDLFHERRYEKGEVIFEKGMPGLGMYIILEGSVNIIGDSQDGEAQVLAQLTAGDFFGEMAVIQEGVRNATAVADHSCLLIGIFRPQLQELLRDRPRLGVVIYQRLACVIADRLKMADDLLLERTQQAGDDDS